MALNNNLFLIELLIGHTEQFFAYVSHDRVLGDWVFPFDHYVLAYPFHDYVGALVKPFFLEIVR